MQDTDANSSEVSYKPKPVERKIVKENPFKKKVVMTYEQLQSVTHDLLVDNKTLKKEN